MNQSWNTDSIHVVIEKRFFEFFNVLNLEKEDMTKQDKLKYSLYKVIEWAVAATTTGKTDNRFIEHLIDTGILTKYQCEIYPEIMDEYWERIYMAAKDGSWKYAAAHDIVCGAQPKTIEEFLSLNPQFEWTAR